MTEQSEALNRMLDQKNSTPQAIEDILGDWRLFAEQLGTPEVLCVLTSAPLASRRGRSKDAAALARFLRVYSSQILVAHELPVIYRSFTHASRSEARELIASDCELGEQPAFKHFARASQYVGLQQLKRLRPLRTERLVQRYLHAVEQGQAYGWHTVVYGLVLSLYSLPLRQGLLNYGRETLRGFINAANPSVQLLPEQCDALHAELCSRLPDAVEALLAKDATVIG